MRYDQAEGDQVVEHHGGDEVEADDGPAEQDEDHREDGKRHQNLNALAVDERDPLQVADAGGDAEHLERAPLSTRRPVRIAGRYSACSILSAVATAFGRERSVSEHDGESRDFAAGGFGDKGFLRERAAGDGERHQPAARE